MKFELLPNEIFINCFEYLDVTDLFNAFDGLNYRFQRLITNLPFSLNFQHIKKTTFVQVCNKMLSNPEMKNQIYSLKLSNEVDTCGQISSFLSLFSLNEFPNLRSLTLIRIKKNEMERVASMSPSLFNLTYLHYDLWKRQDTILAPLLLTNIRKFHVEYFNRNSLYTHRRVFIITHLTIFDGTSDDFNKFFTYIPMLQYLNVRMLRNDYSSKNNLNLTNTHAVCLKQLILGSHDVKFDDFENILKQTPNLKILKLSNDSHDDAAIDANRWQNLISLFLPYLYIFKFHFMVRIGDKLNIAMLKEFDNDFWTKQHHWYTAYTQDKYKTNIFTIPYWKTYFLMETSSTNFYCNNASIDRLTLFDNVTYLRLSPQATIKDSVLKFLHIEQIDFTAGYFLAESNFMEKLRTTVNLSKLKQLDMDPNSGIESSMLLQILKEASHVSSISIDKPHLMPLLINGELCTYLNKMITKLVVLGAFYDSNIVFDPSDKIWKIFSNLEQLVCEISRLDDLVELSNRLPKLTNLTVHCEIQMNKNVEVWLEENVPQLNANCHLDHRYRTLYIWIGRETI